MSGALGISWECQSATFSLISDPLEGKKATRLKMQTTVPGIHKLHSAAYRKKIPRNLRKELGIVRATLQDEPQTLRHQSRPDGPGLSPEMLTQGAMPKSKMFCDFF